MKKRSQSGFSLIELLVVIGIIASFLALGGALLRGAGKGESRQALRSLVRGALVNAQTKALTSGEPVAFVMMPYDRGREGQLGRAFAIFEVSQDEATKEFVAGKQFRRWFEIPGRFIFSKAPTVSKNGQNGFEQDPIVEVRVPNPKGEGKKTVAMPAIIFGGGGNVIWPSGGGELELHFEEGSILGGQAVATGVDIDDWEQREIFIIGRQTGRVRLLETK